MDLSFIVLRMLVLFILMCVGYVACKVGLMNEVFNKQLSNFVVNVAVPAMILYSVMGDERLLTNREVLLLLLIAFGTYGLMILLSRFIPVLLRYPRQDRSLVRFLLIFSNTGFMGYPVVAAIFGSNAVFYAALFNIPFNILAYSYGIKLVSNGNQGGFNLKTILSPAVLASFLSIIIYFLQLPIPEVITQPLGYLQDMTVPAAMCIIGSSLAMAPLRELFSGIRVYLLTFVKLLILPLMIFGLLSLLPLKEIMLQVATVMWMLPSATNTTMLATLYGGDEFQASKGVFVTTVFSCVTIPLLCYLLFIR